jgi:hypothetical protein
MNINMITEGTAENMSIIRDITKLVLSNLPKTFYENKSFTKNGFEFAATTTAPYTIEELKEKYKSKQKVIKHLEETTFEFINYPDNAKVKTYGQYAFVDNTITINLAGIANRIDAIEPDGRINLDKLLKEKNSSFALIPVVFHEIRHAFQKIDYTQHFFGKGREGEYKQRDIEIDAMWHDSLEAHDINYFKNAKAYATAVMNNLKSERELTPEQEKHYWYKTIKYYLNPTIKEPAKNTRERLEQYITIQVPKNILQLFEKRLDRNTRGDITDLDLRRIPGYKYKNFFFPVPRIWGAVTGALKDNSARNNFQKNMIYLLAAVVLTQGENKIAKDIVKYMTKVHNYTPQQAIASLDEGIPPELFNIEQVRQHMRNIYGV